MSGNNTFDALIEHAIDILELSDDGKKNDATIDLMRLIAEVKNMKDGSPSRIVASAVRDKVSKLRAHSISALEAASDSNVAFAFMFNMPDEMIGFGFDRYFPPQNHDEYLFREISNRIQNPLRGIIALCDKVIDASSNPQNRPPDEWKDYMVSGCANIFKKYTSKKISSTEGGDFREFVSITHELAFDKAADLERQVKRLVRSQKKPTAMDETPRQ